MASTPLILPCLRGHFGDWVYYSSLMPTQEIAARVSYATEVHPDKALSELIQRSLEGPRAKHIAEYLKTTERFFNSMVLATYGGDPEWFELGNFGSRLHPDLVSAISESSVDTLGFLKLTGKEKIFAVDGQHRLAGIKLASTAGDDLSQDQVSVILVAHKKTKSGLQRTRRLFTTLNKTAIPAHKKDIIALDEDDVMAIVARRMVETRPEFKSPKIAVIGSPNLPVTNRIALTSISNLYDVLKVLFLYHDKMRSDRYLRFNRPPDAKLDRYFEFAMEFFTLLAEFFRPVKSLFESDDPGAVTSRYRGPNGGHLLFRTIGLDLVARLTTEYARENKVGLRAAFERIANMPTDVSKVPYRGIIWNPTKQVMLPKGKTLARDLIKHMAGIPTSGKLLEDYRKALGHDPDDTSISLPLTFRKKPST